MLRLHVRWNGVWRMSMTVGLGSFGWVLVAFSRWRLVCHHVEERGGIWTRHRERVGKVVSDEGRVARGESTAGPGCEASTERRWVKGVFSIVGLAIGPILSSCSPVLLSVSIGVLRSSEHGGAQRSSTQRLVCQPRELGRVRRRGRTGEC